MRLRFAQHVVAKTGAISREQWHEVEASFLWLTERIERTPRGSDLVHDVSVLPLHRGEEPSLEAVQTPQKVRAQPAGDIRTHRRRLLCYRIAQPVESLLDRRPRCVELFDHPPGNMGARDA